ncbi:MAG: glycosyltransferase family 4 protein [Acidimicrobiales bacterium]
MPSVPNRALPSLQVLFAVVHFDLLTGSALYVYELSRNLVNRGHGVTVASPFIGGELTSRARAAGVRVVDLDFESAPAPDVLHLNQPEPGLAALSRYPDSPAVATIHSPWSADRPLVSDRIARYLCVRPELRRLVIRRDGLDASKVAVVGNGIDFRRFHRELPPPELAAPSGGHRRPVVLFAGTVTDSREAAARALIRRSHEEDFDVLFVGVGPGGYLEDLPANVRWDRRQVWNMEDVVRSCDEVAGVFVGRTILEGWACGKPGRVYFTSEAGEVLGSSRLEAPPPGVMAGYDIERVTTQMEAVYVDALAGCRPAVSATSRGAGCGQAGSGRAEVAP